MRYAQSLSRPALWLAVAALLLAGCSPRPFEVEPPRDVAEVIPVDPKAAKLGPHDYDPRPRPISLCYSSQLNTREQVVERARSLCPNGGGVRFFDEDALLNQCGLFQPVRVTFICTPGPQPPSPYY